VAPALSENLTLVQRPDAVAIIGQSGRFPGASSIAELWQNLVAGRECISRFSEQELLASGVSAELLADRNYVRARPTVEHPDYFDAEFFGYSAREAERIDPQHRLFLECAWEALEDAGYDPASYPGWIGVYGAASINSYLLHHHGATRDRFEQADALELLVASEKDYLATRVAYKLDLRGPAIGIQSACSSSLVAVHQACQAILSGQCDMALAGGASLSFPDRVGYLSQPEGVESPDGRCRPFDAGASGTVFGDAVGVVLLKRLEDAVRDRDPVRAVILGCAVNNDGNKKLSFTAPSVEGQARVISLAHAAAAVEPDSIGYVEAHGTGTPLGDPIEVTALTRAFRRKTARVGFCALGSIKSNLGHTNSAAGVVSLIKAALAIEHAQLPPTLHVQAPNPKAELQTSPFFLNRELCDWSATPRRAGVSSFGIGGTNVHLILEQAPERARPAPISDREQILPLSARTPQALFAQAERLAAHLEWHPELDLCDVAHTLQMGRRPFDYRLSVVARTRQEALVLLRERAALPPTKSHSGARVAFLFTGQGTQYPGMAAELYASEPVFREAIDRAASALRPHLEADIRELIWPSPERAHDAEKRLSQMLWAQPAVFAIEYALAELLQARGLTPALVLGHSLGEIAAACVAGVFTLAQAAQFSALRGRWMEAESGGGMLSVPLDASELEPELGSELSVATINAPGACVIAGDDAPLLDLAQRLERRGISAKRLNIPCAAHSRRMAGPAQRIRALLSGWQLGAPRVPFCSSASADFISAAELTSPDYWANQLLGPVRFSAALSRVASDPELLFLELGPGKTLATLVELHGAPYLGRAIPTLPGAKQALDARRILYAALGELWQRGLRLDWATCGAPEGLRVSLPSYPFERKRHCVEAPNAATAPRSARPFKDWFSIPSLRRVPEPNRDETATVEQRVLLLHRAECAFASALEHELRQHGHDVRGVGLHPEESTFSFDAEHHPLSELGPFLASRQIPFEQLIFSFVGDAAPSHAEAELWQLLETARGLAALEPASRALSLITSGALADGQNERLIPSRVALMGACRSLTHDLPGLACRLLDVRLPEQGGAYRDLARRVLNELRSAASEPIVALRGDARLVPSLDSIELEGALGASRLEQGGVYLISGGFSGLGRELARHLAQRWQARLILLGRPAPAAQPRTLESVERGRFLSDLERSGCEVCALFADLADEHALGAAIAEAVRRFGRIDGAFHAAGVAAQGLLAEKSRTNLERVLAPKLRGSELLLRLLAPHGTKFLILFSSTFGLSGGPGQTEYSAANQYLAGFAEARSTPELELIAVHWDAWEKIGIAARKGLVRRAPPAAGAASTAPKCDALFDRQQALSPSAQRFEKRLSLADDWLLSEHRIQNDGVLPGTAYLAFALAALRALGMHAACELRELRFLAPCRVPDGQELVLRLETTAHASGWDLRFSVGHERAESFELVATALALPAPSALVEAPAREDWTSARQRAIPLDPSSLYRAVNDSGIVEWGPRWDCLSELYRDGELVLGQLALSARFSGDLEHYSFHPALLDVATALVTVGAADGVYLPASYQRISLFSPLRGTLRSWVARRPSAEPSELCCDVLITDDAGQPLLEVEGFRLKHTPLPRQRARSIGIEPERGLLALENILCLRGFRQIVVSPRAPGELLRSTRPKAHADLPGQTAADGNEPRAMSPEQVASAVTAIWRDLLGLKQVDERASFFELGGHSLLALQLQLRIRQALGVHLPLRDFFRAATLAQLTPLLVELVAGEKPLTELGKALAKAAEQPDYPLTPAQRRVFFLQQLAPDSTEYNNPTLLRIRGPIAESALRAAVARLLERHESLRTSYHVNDAEPVQRIHEQVEVEVTSRTIAAVELEQAVRDAIRPFALEHAPLARVELLWLASDDVTLVFDVHHIAADGLSMERLGRELLQLLEGRPLDALTSRYRDYVAWLSAERSSAEHEARRRYWLDSFAEPPAPLELPLDFARPKVTDRTAETLYFEFDGEQSAAIRRLASARGVTPFLLLLGVYAAFLARLTGQQDFVIGTPTAGRRHPAIENVIGMFVSTLPLRSQPRHTLRFNEFLAALSEVTLAAQDNQDYPFEELIALLDVPRNVDRNPLFDVFFSFQEAGLLARAPRAEGSAFDVQVDIPPARHAKFDLTLRVLDCTSHFSCAFEYRRALFEPSTMARFQAYFTRLAQQVLSNPELVLGELELVLPEERAAIERWNRTDAEFPPGTVLDRFRAQCRLTPDALAASDESGTVSYAELERRSAALAAELARHGLGPGRIAAVLLDRSITMTVALWAVLATGAAYLPLDPRYPDARLCLLLEDSQAALLLADDANWLRARTLGATVPIVCATVTDQPAPSVPTPAGEPHLASPTARDLAYVIYTSGSTGKPKGVLIEHGSLVNRLSWMQKQFPLTPSDVILQKTPYSFDVSVWELFLWVFSGASLHFLAPGAERDPDQIARAIGERKVTVLHFVPPMLGAFLEHIATAEGSRAFARWPLKYVFASGEALTQKHAQAFNHSLRQTGARLINLYGPTEATIDVSYHEVSATDVPRNIPIGRPIDNTGLLVVNAAGQLQPPRIPGELWITGVGLARGYLNRPELTAEKFVAHPFQRGARAYRSGDQARWRDDGEIEFLGRIDQQIKLRGHRIETQEIEAALRALEGVQEAFVQLEAHASPRLVGYYAAEPSLAETSVRERLTTLLPDYMVPSLLCRLDRFPLTASGKLDRRALPAPADRPARAMSQASTERERLIQSVFSELLPGFSAELGIDEDFFELGGDSIKAILLAARLRKHGLSLEVADVFRGPTIRALAQRGDTIDSAGARPETASEYARFSLLTTADRARLTDTGELARLQDAYPLPAMHEQVLAQNILAEKRGLTCHCYELALRGDLDAQALERAWQQVVARHEVLRSVFLWRRVSQPLQLVYRELELPLELHDFSNLPAAERRAREQVELARMRGLGFKPHVAPLLRALYIRHEPHAATLWLFVQNSLFDAWSAGVLARDLLNGYAAERTGQALALPSAAPFGRFVRWLHEQPREPAARFWRTHLLRAPLPPLAEPQLGLSEAAESSGAARYGEIELVLRSSAGERLHKLARRLKLPLNVLIHAVWAACFVEPHAPADVLIGTVTSGRPAALPGVEELVGLFTNVLPLRLTLSRENSVRECLERVAATLLELREYEHSELDAIARAAELKVRDLQQLLHRRTLVFLNTPDFTPDAAQSMPLELELRGAQAHLDVALRAYVTPGDELRWKLRFDRTLTSERYARSLLARVQHLSEALPAAHTVQDWLFFERSPLNDGLQA